MVADVSRNPLGYMGISLDKTPSILRAERAPTTSDVPSRPTVWVDTTTNSVYFYTSGGDGSANWEILGGATAAIASINSNAPVSGNYTLAGTASQITATDTAGTTTFSLSEALPLTATVSMTSAQVKALATTPIQLVAAPGAGKAIKFMNASLKLVYGGSNGFTEAGDNLGIKYTDASGVQVSQTVECTGFIDQTASTYTNAEAAINAIVAASAAENQALVLDNLGSNFAGNAANDNTLEVSVLYRVVEI